MNLEFIFTLFILVSTFLVPSYCDEDNHFHDCGILYNCGLLANVSYPFWGGNRPNFCGRQEFELTCRGSFSTKMTIWEQDFHVMRIDHSHQTLTLAPAELLQASCPKIISYAFDFGNSLLKLAQTVVNLTLFYHCSPSVSPPKNNILPCQDDDTGDIGIFYMNDSFVRTNGVNLSACTELQVQVNEMSFVELKKGKLSLFDSLTKGFDVRYDVSNDSCFTCEGSGGKCGSDINNADAFTCFCRDQPHPQVCKNHDDKVNMKTKVIIGVIATFVGVVLACTGCYLYQRRKKKLRIVRSTLLSRSISADDSSVSDVEKGKNLLGVHLFTYAELEEATNYFDSAKELGDGGFGTVYYGKLQDGRSVAVKRLYENNYKRVGQFMNEVEILTRLRHPHLVSLFGCTSRHSRELLLVYEYVPNGTVADHLHGERAEPGALPWPIRLNIAIETASALTYLHATDIIHRDVKTNNILVHNNFSVKVADFGLSRLFPTDVTHVSTAPQGTPGYVDPEYHQCYQLTEKSDVFSYGVVLIELISSLPAVDITRHRHEINLSTLAINKIQNHALHELVDPSLGFESDSTIREMIAAVAEVAFQCLQSEKDMRPSMLEVLESLLRIQSQGYNTGKAEEMDIPAADVVLLKSGPLQLSPESETVNLVSRSTTSNTST